MAPCPKCSTPKVSGEDTCRKCGIIFSRVTGPVQKLVARQRSDVLVTTGDLARPYRVLRPLFVYVTNQDSMLRDAASKLGIDVTTDGRLMQLGEASFKSAFGRVVCAWTRNPSRRASRRSSKPIGPSFPTSSRPRPPSSCSTAPSSGPRPSRNVSTPRAREPVSRNGSAASGGSGTKRRRWRSRPELRSTSPVARSGTRPRRRPRPTTTRPRCGRRAKPSSRRSTGQ